MGKNFLDLPAEMRNQIYSELFTSIPPAAIQFFGQAKTITAWRSPECTRSDKYHRLPCPTAANGGPLAITLVKKEIHDELKGLVSHRAYTLDVDHNPTTLWAVAPDGIQVGFPCYQYPEKKNVSRITITNVGVEDRTDDIPGDVRQQILDALLEWSKPLTKEGILPPVVDLIGRRGEVMNLRVNKLRLNGRNITKRFEFTWGRMYADRYESKIWRLVDGLLQQDVKTVPRYGPPFRTYPISDGYSLSDVRGLPGYLLSLTMKIRQEAGEGEQDPGYWPRLDFIGELQRFPRVEKLENGQSKDRSVNGD